MYDLIQIISSLYTLYTTILSLFLYIVGITMTSQTRDMNSRC